MDQEFSPQYDPHETETRIYKLWEDSGFFNPDKLPDAAKREPYTIIMPPPNANAPLHVGHALGFTIEDILIRYHRMRGRRALWLPGTDHAGFETQVVFEKKLEKEGHSRFEMPRGELYKAIWDFVEANRHVSETGIKRLGASCDWSRNIFTLDPRIVKIVYRTFEEMRRDGLVYRGDRICNWCTKHQTGLSDLETKYVEREDPLYYIKYGPLELATVRPETKFGDTGVAVNPDDKRYKNYVGKEIEIETILGSRKIKVIADSAVDMAFGTGVIKVTPAHDTADFEIWQRHKDEIPGPKPVIDKFGKMNELAGPYAGMKIGEARKKLVEDMAQKGLINPAKTDPHYKHNIQVCYKCGTTIEPLIIPQWYVAMNKKPLGGRASLRDMAIKAITGGEVKFVSERFEKIFMHWMENLRDWPISRQITWGIPIPAWHCGGLEKSALPKMGFHEDVVPQVLAGKTKTYRLRDHQLKIGGRVLFENSQTETLFGYGIITGIEKTAIEKIDYKDPAHYAVYRNPEELMAAFKLRNPEKEFSPQSTAYSYSYEFLPFDEKDARDGCGQIIISENEPKECPACGGKNLTRDPDTFDTWFSSGQWPYATLLAHGEQDLEKYFPTQVMETGWDILFFWVARMIMMSYYKTGKPPFRTVYLHGLVRDKDKQKMSKSKGNVIDPLGVIDLYGTDALRFALVFSTAAGNDIPLDEQKIKGMKHFANKLWNIARYVARSGILKPDGKPEPVTDADKEILRKLDDAAGGTTKHIDDYEFHEAAQSIYQFIWREFADVYIEKSKPQLEEAALEENTRKILNHVLLVSLKLLHPFMPYITEEIYQKLYPGTLLMIEKWPTRTQS